MKLCTEQYLKFPRSLIESPVLQVLNPNEWRWLLRILIEHQRKSGFVNEGLPVTKRNFIAAGVHRNHIEATQRVIDALGIVKLGKRGRGGTMAHPTPNLWRPTFLPSTPKTNDATHEYRKIKTVTEARAIAKALRVRDTRDRRPPSPKRKRRPHVPVNSHAN